jgi:hypothetical protein
MHKLKLYTLSAVIGVAALYAVLYGGAYAIYGLEALGVNLLAVAGWSLLIWLWITVGLYFGMAAVALVVITCNRDFWEQSRMNADTRL